MSEPRRAIRLMKSALMRPTLNEADGDVGPPAWRPALRRDVSTISSLPHDPFVTLFYNRLN